ncbi:hypothetical protein BT63DRAFT_79303 [Microthyrium microscopicum]|uniref:Uncharacterized protein n=1 Tax=Microthyrium microscopicum TaxID=703497 RepID=A0A6A6TYK9_9PEZI|nr:hypothetical protein BT63DRAFT_79303 [Microthyrium microscopicum]
MQGLARWVQNYSYIVAHAKLSFCLELSSRPILDSTLPQKFLELASREQRVWADSGSAPEHKTHLVQPSGSLDALLAHHLHQPSLATSTPCSPVTADRTNVSISMVMGNGFREGNTLIYDQIHRRSKDSDGLNNYPESVIQAHEDFTYQLMESSAAKVEIIYGRPVQKRIMKRLRMTIIPLWERFEGLFLFLLHEGNFVNHSQDFMFRKVLVFAAHPQRLLYAAKGSTESVRQDKVLEIALQIADPSIIFDPKYYQNREWEPHVKKAKNLRNVGDSLLRAHLYSLQDPVRPHEIPEAQSPKASSLISDNRLEPWDRVFNARPHSSQMSRTLLPHALEAIRYNEEEEWKHPSDFHPAVTAWFKGQRDVFFYQTPLRDIKDLLAAVRCHETPLDEESNCKKHDLRWTLKALMLAQDRCFRSIKASKHDEKLFHRVGAGSLAVSCPCGSIRFDDLEPRFSCSRPSAYVVRERNCIMPECNPKSVRRGTRQLMIPVSKDQEYVRAKLPDLDSEKARRIPGELFLSLIRSPTDQGPPITLNAVELWCMRCRERTEMVDGLASYFDTFPRWTIGFVRPLYIERRPHCVRCERSNGIPGRNFLPKDDSLPSISPRRLSRFLQNYGEYDQVIQAALLDSYLPSSNVLSDQDATSVAGSSDQLKHHEALGNMEIENKMIKVVTDTAGMNK